MTHISIRKGTDVSSRTYLRISMLLQALCSFFCCLVNLTTATERRFAMMESHSFFEETTDSRVKEIESPSQTVVLHTERLKNIFVKGIFIEKGYSIAILFPLAII